MARLLPLAAAARHTVTSLWNDSADADELTRSIGFGAVGATCNPVIALSAIRRHLDVWGPRVRELQREFPTETESELGWRVVEELSVSAAAMLEPAFRASGGRNGRLSIQTDPRLHRDTDAIVAQAVRFSALAPNIIVKIPATSAGIPAIEEATFRGVSINATVSFTVPQAVAVAEAVERGLDRRTAAGLPTPELGSVVTIMAGRLDDWLKVVASREVSGIDPGHLEWAGVAVAKRAYELFEHRGYRARLLVGAFRNPLPFTEFVGGDLVITMPFEWQERINASGVEPALDQIRVPVDPQVVSALYAGFPDFRHAYDTDGLTPAGFDEFPVTRRTLRQFLDAVAQLDALIRDILLPDP